MSSKCTKAAMIESRGLGSFAAARSNISSSMIKLIVIITLTFRAVTLAGNSNPVIGKCCPCGQVISVSDNFTCAFTEDRGKELYQFAAHEDHELFASCPDEKNLTITNLAEIEESTIRAQNACVDILYDDEDEQSVPIIFQCRNNGTSGDETASGSLVVPNIPTLRLCCGIDQVYDVKLRECVFKKDGLNVPKYFGFLEGIHDFLAVVRGAPPCQYAILDYVVNVTRDVRVHGDGRLEVVLNTKKGPQTIIADENNTCLDPGNSSPGLVVFRGCSDSKYCREYPCVRKCCREDQAFVDTKCDKIPLQNPPPRFHEILHNASIQRALVSDMDPLESSDYGMLIGKPCKFGMFPVDPNERWHITPRGYVYVPNYKFYDHNDYCMEMFFGNARLQNDLYPVVCFDSEESPDDSSTRFQINAGLELTSCAFLIITLLVYICLPVLRNLHGKTLMCHVLSLIVAYACLAAVALGTPPTTGIPGSKGTRICQFLGFTTLLAWFSAFSWLNVMCFDIWWTFGGLGGAASSSRGRAYKKRFLMYSLYAWGVSLTITCLGVAADTTGYVAFYLRPNIGVDSCWFERNVDLYGEMIFFIGPVSLQLIANIIFFGLTARYCSKVKAEITKVMATPTDPRRRRYHADRTKLIMNMKLFIVMGVSWIFEVISFFLNHYAVAIAWRVEFFYVSDAFNCLQGLMIFILFVLKSKVYNALMKRLGRGKGSNAPNSNVTNGLQDPYRVRKSVSNSTIMSNSALSTSPY